MSPAAQQMRILSSQATQALWLALDSIFVLAKHAVCRAVKVFSNGELGAESVLDPLYLPDTTFVTNRRTETDEPMDTAHNIIIIPSHYGTPTCSSPALL